jgi:hypothetical protein
MIEFNPKGGSILDQELSASGLEMNIAPLAAFTIGTTLLSTGASVFGSINASASATRQANFQREQAAISSQHAYDVAVATNAYLDDKDAFDEAQYNQERDFAFNSLMKDWKYGKQIHKLEQLNRMQEWRKSKRLGRRQTRLNAQAERQAIAQEQGVLTDAFLQHQFSRQSNLSALNKTIFESQLAQQSNIASLNKSFFEGKIALQQQGIKLEGIKDRQAYGQVAIQESINQMMDQNALQKESTMVEGLIAQGQAELGQAGKSTAKGIQSTKLALSRSLRSLDSELSGRYKQAAIQMAELNADASLQIANVELEKQLTGGMLEFAQQEFELNSQRLSGMMAFAQEEFAFNNQVLDATLNSAIAQSQRNIKDIMLDRKFADLDVEANMLLKPNKLPYQPKPMLPPEREFLESMRMVVPEVTEYKSASDRFKKLLKKQDSFGGRPGEYSPSRNEESKPYLDDKGKVKKGYRKTYIKGNLYYQHKKSGKTYLA